MAAQGVGSAAQTRASGGQPVGSAAQPVESAAQTRASGPRPVESAAQTRVSGTQPVGSAARVGVSAAQTRASAAQAGESAAQPGESAERERPRVLFLCTHNSARSQMAEAMLRAWAGDRFEAHSAGIEVTRVRPEAIAVMDELGIDLHGQRSKHVAGFAGQRFDWAITTCDEECAACPVFPGAGHREYWVFDDPSATGGSGEARLAVYRRVRDEIGARIREFIGRA